MAQLFGSLVGIACGLQLMGTYGTGWSSDQGVHGRSLLQIQSKQDSGDIQQESELWTETKLANMTVSADPEKCYVGLVAGKKCQSSGGIYLISSEWYSGHLGGAQTIQRLCGKVSEFWTSLNPAHKGCEVALMNQQDLDNRAFFVASLDCADKNSATVMPKSTSRTPMVLSTSAMPMPQSSTSTSTTTTSKAVTTTTTTQPRANFTEYPRGSAEDARFLIQASFGPTRESLRNLGNLSYEAWIQEQVVLPPSLHRSFYRERANPHLLGAYSDAGGSRGACEPGSRWQAFAFSLKDLGKYITVSQGKVFVAASANQTGSLRTELDPERKGNGFSLDNSSGWRMKDTVCAPEGHQCECTGLVKFGAASKWSTWGYVSGQIACRIEVFGDPFPDRPKHCVCRTRQEATIEVIAKICYVEEFFNGRVKFCKPDTGGVDAGDVVMTVGNPYIWFRPSHPANNNNIDNLRFQILRPGVVILSIVQGKCELGDFLHSAVEDSEGRHYLHDPRVKLLTNDLNLPGQSSAARSFVNEESCVLINGLLRCGSPGETANNPWKGHQTIFHAGEASPPSVASPPLDVDLTGEFSNVFADRVFDFPHGPALWDVPPESARSSVWLMQTLYAGDQLRQRMAWALSQILVTSAQGTDYGLFSEMWMSYYDIFVRHGLHNFRDVLREVTYSPVMGMYLTSLKNKAFDASQTRPNENFAREIMQLFTIGEWKLNPDGTLMLGEDGMPLRAYENEHIMSLSRVFTGFDTQEPRSNLEVPMGDFTNFIDPMQMRADWHDAHPKIALDGGYFGDGYPQCKDLSSHAHLSKGARYVIRSQQQPKETTSVLQNSQGLAADWKPVDGGAGRACRGASKQDNSADHYVLHAGLTNIDDCKSKCAETQSCRGIEHSTKSARCEVWTRDGGIQASISLPGFICLSYDVSARSTTAVPGQIDGSWEFVDGGVDRVCRGATDKDNNDSYFILRKNVFSLDDCKSECTDTPACQGIEHNKVAGRCELWTRAEGIEASANVAGYTCLRYSMRTTQTTTMVNASQTFPQRIGGTLLAQSGTLLSSLFCPETPCRFSPVVTLQERVLCKDADCGVLFATSVDVENVIYDYQPAACVHPYFHDGASIVIDEEGSVSQSGEEANKVKVYWHRGAPQQCPSTCISSNTSCTCSAAVRRAPVFTSTPEAARLKRLKVSSYTPDMGCTKNCKGDVKVYSATGAFDEDSVFEHEGVFFKNVEEVVDLGGWTFRNPPNFMPPSGATNEVRIKAALDEVESVLDILFHHPNTPVFIAYRLIQRLVSSNPSRKYIQAVENAFRTGEYEGKVYTGRYGDLAATAAAVLLHPEARGAGSEWAGKLREPLLKVLHFMRSLEFQEQPGRMIVMKKLEKIISQFPYESPTVFNYYLPSYGIEARGSNNNNGGWVRIMHCDGPSSSNRFDFSPENIMQMAAAATKVKICTKGDPGDCVVSQPNSFPINMLRQGKGVSHNDRSTCDAKCVSKTWANTGRDRLSHLWSRCGSMQSLKGSRSSMYWACGNSKGLHLDARDGGSCSWTWRGSDDLEVFIDGVSSNDSSYILYRSGASSCPLGFAPVAEDRCLSAVSALRGTIQNMSALSVGSWSSAPSGCSVQVVTDGTAYKWAAYYNSYLYADNGGDFIPVCQKSENVSVELVAPELEIFDTPNVIGFTDAMLAMVEDQSLSSCNKGFGIDSFGCGGARPMNYSGTVQEVWDQMDLLLTGRRLGSMKQTLMDTYGSGATSHIEVLGGVSGNRMYASPAANGRDVDLAGFRRPWLIEKGSGNWYTIRISGDVSSDRTYLSTTRDGSKVDLWFRDDRSGRQRWVISKGTGDWYTIRVLGGVRGFRRYLSTNMAGTRAFLHTRDDGSGRQRWTIPAYPDASGTQNATIDDIRGAQYSIVITPHFHTLGNVKPLGTRARPPVSLPEPTGNASDYKAVVILFLFGGADTFNMLVPLNCALYDEYVSIRRGVALSPSQLLRIGVVGQACSDFGIHSELPVLKQLYDSKEAAFVTNVGNLIEPTLGRMGARICPGNFGHSGMQHASQTLICQEGMGLMHGGGGRMADALTSDDASVKAVHSFSLAGNQPWSQGENTKRSVVDGNQVNIESDKPGRSQRIIDKLTTIDFSTVYAKEYTSQVDQALNAYKAVLDVFQNAESLLQNASLDYGGIPQLRQVATLIAARQLRQSRRDFFFVGFGGFDNHGNLAANLARRFSSMNVAISAFVSEMKAQSVWDNVLLATQSDFARTLDPNGNMGTDHGWAGQHFLLSGAIKGGRVYNTFPSPLAAGNPADLGRGRLIPEYPYESFMVPIAKWLGVKPNQLNTVFPNLPNFNASAHLIAGLF